MYLDIVKKLTKHLAWICFDQLKILLRYLINKILSTYDYFYALYSFAHLIKQKLTDFIESTFFKGK